MAKYLPNFGWDTRVLTVDENFHKEPPDPALASLLPPHIAVERISALPYGLTRLLGVGDLSLRAMPFLPGALRRSIHQFTPQVIFMTGWPFYQMLLSHMIKAHWNIPVVLDFQDPWVSNEGALRKPWSKGGLAHRLAVALEPMAVQHAGWITSVSERQNNEMADRYPFIDRNRMTAIPIGGDPEDFSVLRDERPQERQSNRFIFRYVGTALPRATSLFRSLFRALALCGARNPGIRDRVRLELVGTSNQASGEVAYQVTQLAAEAGVSDLVVEKPARVPYLDALRLLATADATLMVGSDEPHYTASKIYPCLMANRPFLSIFHRESSAHQILTDAGGGLALAFDSDKASAELENAIADAIELIVSAPNSLGPIDPDSYCDFTAAAVAKQFADVFEMACN
nr:glycosyltransferase [Porphyrobacter sp. SLTP]